MSKIDENLLTSFGVERKIETGLPIRSFQENIYEALKYPGLSEYLDFFTVDMTETIMENEENMTALYYSVNMMYKKLPELMKNFDRGKGQNLTLFLIESFFLTRDSRIGRIPTMVNKNTQDIEDMINREELRKEYPLAAKSNNYLLRSNTFLNGIKNKFLSDYCSKNPDFYNNIIDQLKDIENPKDLYREIIETLTDMETGSNVTEIYIKEYLLQGLFERFHIDNEKKKNKLNQNKNKENIDNKKSFQKMIDEDSVKVISNISLLNDEQIKLVDKIIQCFNVSDEKEKKKIKKFIIRLIVNKKPLKVFNFLNAYNLEKIPDNVVLLLDDLGIDIVYNQQDNEENKFAANIENCTINNEDSESINVLAEETNKKLLGLFMENPLSAIMEKAKMCGYEIENENLLKKQIDSVCKSSKYVKDSLLLSLFKESFSRPILKNSGAYSLRAGGTGYRFVLKQNDDGKFSIVGFYNHDDYEKILDGRKW